MASLQWREGQVSINDQRRRKTTMLFIPVSAPMRADPRFEKLTEDTGMADYWRRSVERVAVWEGPDERGYVVVSVQGRSTFAVYDRTAPHAYRGSFRIEGGQGADGVTGTDGIAITSAPLGPRYPRGLFVAQDDENTHPAATQNFKYVSWADIEDALGLHQDNQGTGRSRAGAKSGAEGGLGM